MLARSRCLVLAIVDVNARQIPTCINASINSHHTNGNGNDAHKLLFLQEKKKKIATHQCKTIVLPE